VAIKKIAPFEHSMFCLRTLRELKLLKYFAECGVRPSVALSGLLAPPGRPRARPRRAGPFDRLLAADKTADPAVTAPLSQVSENVNPGCAADSPELVLLLLLSLPSRSQIISVIDIIKPPSLEAFKEVYRACLFRTPFPPLALTDIARRLQQSSRSSWRPTCTASSEPRTSATTMRRSVCSLPSS
jgi:hypothetical protein